MHSGEDSGARPRARRTDASDCEVLAGGDGLMSSTDAVASVMGVRWCRESTVADSARALVDTPSSTTPSDVFDGGESDGILCVRLRAVCVMVRAWSRMDSTVGSAVTAGRDDGWEVVRAGKAPPRILL